MKALLTLTEQETRSRLADAGGTELEHLPPEELDRHFLDFAKCLYAYGREYERRGLMSPFPMTLTGSGFFSWTRRDQL